MQLQKKHNFPSFAICSISFHLVMFCTCYEEYHGACKAPTHTKKHTLIMEDLTKSKFPLTWTRNSARHPARICSSSLHSHSLVISILTRCSSPCFENARPQWLYDVYCTATEHSKSEKLLILSGEELLWL